MLRSMFGSSDHSTADALVRWETSEPGSFTVIASGSRGFFSNLFESGNSVSYEPVEDGWVRSRDGELLVWVPPRRRWSDAPRTKVDFSKAALGRDWIKGFGRY